MVTSKGNRGGSANLAAKSLQNLDCDRLAIKVCLVNQRDEIVVEGRHVYRILAGHRRAKAKRAPRRPLS
jgi:hypothetical protein